MKQHRPRNLDETGRRYGWSSAKAFSGLCRALCLAFLFFTKQAAFGQDAATQFEEANRLYEQGKYPQSIEAYHKLIDAKKGSAAVYFNLGNAWFRNGQPGEAIAAYRLAERLAPRDPDILANLRFAREQVQGGATVEKKWVRWLSILTLNELTLFAMATVWSWFMLLTLGHLRREWRQPLRSYAQIAGFVSFLSVLWLGVMLQSRLGNRAAIVIRKEAVVRHGPFSEAQAYYTVHDGAELAILDRKDIWLQVRDQRHGVGWLQQKEVTILPQG